MIITDEEMVMDRSDKTTRWNNVKARVQYLKGCESVPAGDEAVVGKVLCEELDRLEERINCLDRRIQRLRESLV